MRTRRPIASATARRRGRIAALALVALALLVSACQPDSGGITPVRKANGALIDISGAHSAGGIMGVDILLGPDEYNPCHLQVDTQDSNVVYNDRFYAACQDANLGRSSYYRHVNYTAGGPQLGAVVIGGADNNHCGGQGWCTDTDSVVMHGWSDKATAWALEFYPGANEGGIRITGRFDQRTLGNFASSGPIGAMRPITDAIPGSFRLAGSVAGGPWPDRRFEVAAFQMPPWTMVTSAYYPEEGFAVIVNSGSSLQSWPMLSGSYKIYVVDHATGASTIVFRNLGPGSRLDLDPGRPCFGLAGGLDPNTEQRVC